MKNVIGISNVTQKGQVTIPAILRQHFELKSFSRVVFSRDADKILIKPLKKDVTDFFGYHKKTGKKSFKPKAVDKGTRLAVARQIVQEGR